MFSKYLNLYLSTVIVDSFTASNVLHNIYSYFLIKALNGNVYSCEAISFSFYSFMRNTIVLIVVKVNNCVQKKQADTHSNKSSVCHGMGMFTGVF